MKLSIPSDSALPWPSVYASNCFPLVSYLCRKTWRPPSALLLTQGRPKLAPICSHEASVSSPWFENSLQWRACVGDVLAFWTPRHDLCF